MAINRTDADLAEGGNTEGGNIYFVFAFVCFLDNDNQNRFPRFIWPLHSLRSVLSSKRRPLASAEFGMKNEGLAVTVGAVYLDRNSTLSHSCYSSLPA